MTIELTPEEAALLRQILEDRHKQLQVEARRADSKDYRDGLHEMLERVDSIRERLEAPATC